MAIGSFALFLIIALVSAFLAVKLENWAAKLVFFIFALGGASTASGIMNLGFGWVLLIGVVLFLVVGISSVRIKHLGNRIVGIVLIIVGLFLIFPMVDALGSATPGTVWNAAIQSFQTGWAKFVEYLQRVFDAA